MASGNEIVLSVPPKGAFFEGKISGTPKPGTVMQVKSGVEMELGRFTFEVYNQASDGTRAGIFVLLPDHLQGKTADDAYVDGSRGFLYAPVMGEELNMRIQDQSGTGATSDYLIGDRLMVDDGTGLLIDDSTGGSVPFVLLETITDLTADYLAHVQYTGH